MSSVFLAQAKDIIVMLYCGLTIEFFYELLSGYRKRKPCTRTFLCASEILFWIFAALLASWFLYYCCYGKISLHSIGALVVGMLLWRFCVGVKISTLIRDTCGIIKGIICKKTKRRGNKYGKKKKEPPVQRKKSSH